MSKQKRIPTDGGANLAHNPFAGLSAAGLPSAPENQTPKRLPTDAPVKNRGRVEIRRNIAGRGGKTVTVVSGFTGISQPEKEQLARQLQKACGTGGTVKEGRIEIQGDQRQAVAALLEEAGFKPVFAGG
jgi:translation initiation factor 1